MSKFFKEPKYFIYLGSVLIFLMGFILHFLYDWTNQNVIVGSFTPIDESIWEHMKIIFTSTLLYGIIDYILLNKYNIKYNNFPFQLYFTALAAIPIYLVIYIPLYNLLGENAFISIALLFMVYIISRLSAFHKRDGRFVIICEDRARRSNPWLQLT